MTKAKNIAGRRFFRLVAQSPLPEFDKFNNVLWKCACDCGNTHVVSANALLKSNTKSCGCWNRERQRNDLTGLRSGKLTAVRPTDRRVSRTVIWECNCDCGAASFVRSTDLKRGATISCGCAGSKVAIRAPRIRQVQASAWGNRRARERQAEGFFTPAEIENLFAKQDGRCAICRCFLTVFQRDHKIPLARGGSNWISNIQLLCKRCNLRKGSRYPEVSPIENEASSCAK